MTEKLKEAKGVDSVTDYVEEREDVGLSKANAGLMLAKETVRWNNIRLLVIHLTLLHL
jgi:hypothetical protein